MVSSLPPKPTPSRTNMLFLLAFAAAATIRPYSRLFTTLAHPSPIDVKLREKG
jgi:hypothetical protein